MSTKSECYIESVHTEVFIQPYPKKGERHLVTAFGNLFDPSCALFLKSVQFEDIKYDYDLRKSADSAKSAKSQNV